jgi:hypothetical protein
VTSRQPTLRLGELTGTWAAVYRRRGRLEADADAQALAAWRELLDALDLQDLADIAAANPPPPGSDEASRLRRAHLQQVLAAAVLARLTQLARADGWPRFLAALAALLAAARAAGEAAGHAVADDNGDGLDDQDGAEPGAAEEVGAYTLAGEAMRGMAAAVARALLGAAADGLNAGQLLGVARSVLQDALGLTLTVATAVGVAFTTGMTAAYAARGAAELAYVTAGDGRVCAACSDAEDNGPYPAVQAPVPPLHPNCRCTLQPA